MYVGIMNMLYLHLKFKHKKEILSKNNKRLSYVMYNVRIATVKIKY